MFKVGKGKTVNVFFKYLDLEKKTVSSRQKSKSTPVSRANANKENHNHNHQTPIRVVFLVGPF